MGKRCVFLGMILLIGLASACSSTKEGETGENEDLIDSISGTEDFYTVNEKIIEDPKDPENYYKRAMLHKDFGSNDHLRAAEADVDRALKLDSLNTKYLLEKADLNRSLLRFSKTREILEKVLTIDDQSVEARLRLADIFFTYENHKQAIKLVNAALKIDPYAPKGYFIKGMIYKERGDTLNAVTSFQTAVEQDNDYYKAYMELGLLYANESDNRAIEYYDNALRINEKSYEANYSKAIFLQENGEPEEALKVYDFMLTLNENIFQVYHNMGYVNLIFLEEYDTAIEHFTKAIEHYPKYVEAFHNRGLSYEKKGDNKKAEENYRLALELKGDFTPSAKGISRVVDGDYR